MPFLSPKACERAPPSASAVKQKILSKNREETGIAQTGSLPMPRDIFLSALAVNSRVNTCLFVRWWEIELVRIQLGLLTQATNWVERPAFTPVLAGNADSTKMHMKGQCLSKGELPMSSHVWWSSIQVSPSASTITFMRPCEASCCRKKNSVTSVC